MRKLIRLAIAAGAVMATLAFTGSAMAAYAPRLIVTSLTNGPNKPTTMLLEHLQTANDDATAKDSIYAPLGYQANLTQTPGTKLGDVDATLILRGGGNATATATGPVVVDSVSNWGPQSQACTGTTVHEAVWRLDITIAGTPLKVPIFVDHSAGADATFSSVKIQFCLQGPIGTPAGAQLLDAFFDIQGVFTSPPNTQDRVWRAVMTPYVAGSPNPNPAGTVESQSVVPGQVAFTAKAKGLKKPRGVVQISGKVLVDGAGAAASVQFYKPSNLTKPLKTVHTARSGAYSWKKKFTKKTRLLVVAVGVSDLGACPATPLPGIPGGCVTATRSFGAATIITATPRKKKR
jgi:hypothetical protein